MFNEDSQETMQDKVLRMIENDLEFTEQSAETGFQKDIGCGTMSVPQMSRPAWKEFKHEQQADGTENNCALRASFPRWRTAGRQ